ncbi:hypothetical protein CK203_088787 [Vitis vinifera]|uniref:Uncharacterized protein n=1 Tax=Vitis vinifera TaxID=29760 RepID=A0A438BRM7_VITVI|nr:hypothetical protein CK203_088787 [Vitis vinifera]
MLQEALYRISKGYFFGPHHLIMAVLLYFEEKILEHLGYPVEPQHERRRIVERFSLSTNGPPPAPAVASSEPTPEVSPSTPQVTPQPPPIIPPTSEPSPSAEPRIAIPIIEYRGLCHTFQALATSHSILTQQITTLPQAPPFMHETMPPEEPPTGEAETVEPSSPQHHPPTI